MLYTLFSFIKKNVNKIIRIKKIDSQLVSVFLFYMGKRYPKFTNGDSLYINARVLYILYI